MLQFLTWDWLLSLEEELRVMQRCGHSVAVFAYCMARCVTKIETLKISEIKCYSISAANLCVLDIILQIGLPSEFANAHKFIASESICFQHLITAGVVYATMDVMSIIACAAKSYILLLRVCAVYGKSKIVTLCSAVCWLGVVGARVAIPFTSHSYVSERSLCLNIGRPILIFLQRWEKTGQCFVSGLSTTNLVALWANLAYDTGVFIAISVRLKSHAIDMPKPQFALFL